jgi:hypothetical protein
MLNDARSTMNVSPKVNLAGTYQLMVYNKALHPDHFPLKGRRVSRQGAYEIEAWVMPGSHMLRLECGPVCASELVTDLERSIPTQGIVASCPCASEKEIEQRFGSAPVVYMGTSQVETLPESLFNSTYDELATLAKDHHALTHVWEDDVGQCLSIVDVQRYHREVHAQAYHMIASAGLVLRTQSLFELR